MTNIINEKIINGPLTKTGLSVKTILFFQSLGYTSIKSIIIDKTPIYGELHNRINKAASIYFKNDEEKMNTAQHAYNDLLEYVKYHGVKFKKHPHHDKIGMIKSEEFEKIKSNIRKKIMQFIEINNLNAEEKNNTAAKYVEQIIDLVQPVIEGLDEIETFIVRFICGIYTKGKEQTIEQTEQYLQEKGYKVEKVGLIFYNAIHKIVDNIESKEKTIIR